MRGRGEGRGGWRRMGVGVEMENERRWGFILRKVGERGRNGRLSGYSF